MYYGKVHRTMPVQENLCNNVKNYYAEAPRLDKIFFILLKISLRIIWNVYFPRLDLLGIVLKALFDPLVDIFVGHGEGQHESILNLRVDHHLVPSLSVL